MKTIDVKERVTTNDEDLYLSIKNREDNNVIDELLQSRYGWAFENPSEIIGYVWAEHGRGYGQYIIHFNVANFPVSSLHVPGFSLDELEEDLEDGSFEWYTDNTFDGHI